MSVDQTLPVKTKKPKTRVAVPGETKNDKFVRLTKSRSNKFIKYFELLHNLVDGYTYVIDPKLAREVLARFQEEFKSLETSWQVAIAKAEKKGDKADADTDGPQPAGTAPVDEESEVEAS